MANDPVMMPSDDPCCLNRSYMSKEAIWVTPPIPATELDGKAIELNISTANKDREGKETHGIGIIRIQPHRSTSGMVCIWVMFKRPLMGEVPLTQIETNHIQPHPDRIKADYLCAVRYATD